VTEPGPHPSPTKAFGKRPLSIIPVPKGHQWFRLHLAHYDPLRFGETRASRFDAADKGFGVLYVARQLRGAFVETLCRNRDDIRPLPASALEQYRVAGIVASRGLKLVDLAGKGLARMGLDGRLSTGDYRVAQRWSVAFHDHPDKPDGILYLARHEPKQQVAALLDRAEALITVQDLGTLRTHLGDEALFELLDHYGIALL